MNWQMVAAVCSILGILTTIICVTFVAGKLTQQISDNRDRHDEHLAEYQKTCEEHERVMLSHSNRLSDHDVELAKLNEWKNGYNAAAAIAHKRIENDGQR